MKKIYAIIAFIAALILVTAGCKENGTSPDAAQSFAGIVKNSAGAPLGNADVNLVNGDNKVLGVYKTDTTGKFTITQLPKEYQHLYLKISYEGYTTLKAQFADILEQNDGKLPESEDFTLQGLKENDDDCCGQMTFSVKEHESDNYLAGVEIKIMMNDNVVAKVYTDENGRAGADKLCKGKYWIRVFKEGYRVIEEDVELGECDTLELTLGLKLQSEEECCNNIATFSVVDENGHPLKGAKVYIKRNGQVVKDGITDENGHISFHELCKGGYGFLVKMEGRVAVDGEFGVDCEQEISKTVTLKKEEEKCCNNNIKVLVKDPATGLPVAGVKLALWMNGKIVYDAFTKEDGTAVIDGICKGKYGVSLVKEGYKGIEWSVEFGCEQSLSFEKGLHKKEETPCCGKAGFYILDHNTGQPVKNAEVKVAQNNTYKILKTDENGYVQFGELCTGGYWVRVAAEGYNVLEEDFKIESCEHPVEMTLKIKPKESEECCNNQMIFNIKNGEGEGLTGVQIKIVRNGHVVATLTTQNGTAATDKKLCKGEYGVRIYKEGYKVIEFGVNLGCEEVKEFEKTLAKNEVCCDAWAKVRVVDSESGEPLNGATVNLWKGGQLQKTLTVEEGYVKFTSLCEGEYGFSIHAEGYKGVEWNAGIHCNKENVFEKGLSKQ